MRHVESAHQRAFIARARMHPVARKVYAIPNGGKRSKITASIMKAEGVRAGVPDTCLPVPAGQCHSLYIEFKAGRGDLTDEQFKVASELVDDGHMVVVAWGWERAWDWTMKYLEGKLPPALVIDK